MFRSLQLNIFIYYFVTVAIFLGILHFLLEVLLIQNTYLVAIVLLAFVSYSGIILSNLAIDPLREYVRNLRNLSKETLHELNLPISTIRTNTQMIKKTLNNEKDLKRLARIDTACAMLEQRYNELEYMIKSQTSPQMKETFDLASLVEERVSFLSPLYPQINFNLDIESSIISNDSIGLSKVIDNIIDNAVKYSQNNNKIDIRLHDNILSIQDYGCGMDEVELLNIFDNYYQSDASMQGFGIGLSLVKRFCDKQEIRLSFKSKPDYGTTVLLKFKKEKE
ncbi:MAG: HAMP domain-containing histidine kinase [Helicobacteraceae bacterium]|nr:HAMP domain-containing histidine kinase [Candidatus Sulfurimonas ponti]